MSNAQNNSTNDSPAESPAETTMETPADDDSRQPSPLNVLLVGEESAGIQALRILAASIHNVVAVMAAPMQGTKSATLWNVAKKMEYITWPGHLVKQANFASHVRMLQVDLLLNVHSLFLIHDDILRACRIGAFNMHPGPLPEYAGLNVPSWTIYHGETEHGVTIHEMVPRIDAGYIAYQQRFPIEDNDTGLSMMSKCVRAGVPLLKQLLDAAARGADQIPRIDQEFGDRRYCNGKPADNGCLHWNRPAVAVVNHIRAADYSPFASPWGHPRSVFAGMEVGIVKAQRTQQPTEAEPGTVGQRDGSAIHVAAADEWVLVRTLQIGGKYCDAADVLSTGARFSDIGVAGDATTEQQIVGYH